MKKWRVTKLCQHKSYIGKIIITFSSFLNKNILRQKEIHDKMENMMNITYSFSFKKMNNTYSF